MDANHQCNALIPNIPVILNIGLGVGQLGGRLSPAHRLALVSRNLRELMASGMRGEVHLVPQHTYIGEPLVIISGSFTSEACSTTQLWDLLVAIEQDCIAVHYPTMPEKSTLFGPRADKWGSFDLTYFNLPKVANHEHILH